MITTGCKGGGAKYDVQCILLSATFWSAGRSQLSCAGIVRASAARNLESLCRFAIACRGHNHHSPTSVLCSAPFPVAVAMALSSHTALA
jgi:hypothetical protein